MATLTSQQLKDSYQSLVTIGDSITSDPTSGRLENGKGTALTAVGIGTDSPTAPLTVQALETGGTVHLKGNTSDGSAVAFRNNAGSANVSLIYTDSTQFRIDTVGSSPIIFKPNSTEAMRIGSGGDISFRDGATNEAFYWDASTARLGIGTTSPDGLLNLAHQTSTSTLSDDASGYALTFDFEGATNDYGRHIAIRDAGGDAVSAIGGFDEGTGGATGLYFATGNTTSIAERMRIDSSGNVGIGTTSPNSSYKTHIEAGSGNNTSLLVTTTDNADVAQVIIGHDKGLQGGLQLVSDKTNGIAKIRATNSSFFPLAFEVRGADGTNERMRILPTGGITFNGDTATANALDDYEEGTWSPVYAPQTGSFATMTMDVISATYTKVGRQVTVRAYFRTDDVDITGGSGALRINGLPFTCATNGQSALNIGYILQWGTSPDGGFINSQTTSIFLYKSGKNTASSVSDLTTGAVADQNVLILTATYFV